MLAIQAVFAGMTFTSTRLYSSVTGKHTAYVGAGTCLSFSDINDTTAVVLGSCPYVPATRKPDEFFKYYLQLPQNISSSNIMCSLFNRQGFLCSSCQPGYEISPYSHYFSCAECDGQSYGVLWYVLLDLIPISLLYIVVVIFRIRATEAPLVGVVLFSQNILSLVRSSRSLYTALVYSTNSFTLVLFHVAFSMCGIWNLDFFRFSVPPFCVSGSINNVYAVALEYVSALYPLFLVVVTFFLIELHARNVRLIVWLYKPFHKCSVKIRRTWDIKQSVINAFSTFLLLSYTKIITISFKLLYVTTIYNIYGNIVALILLIDPKVQYFGAQHTPFAVFAILIITTLILAIVLLVLYPTKLFQKLIGHCHCRAIHGVHAFVDTYQGCLKDYTSGTRDYRSVSAAYLAMRFVLLSIFVAPNGLTLIIFGLLYLCSWARLNHTKRTT